MLYVKKYFTEGLIQMAILLSLCGMRVDVGLESYLPPSWQEIILGPTSALTPTQFHNLRNSLEDGHGRHPKSVDLDSFFTARRLLGWVRSLDRLQVPHAELETWLVQREADPLPMECPEQPSLLERDQTSRTGEPRSGRGILQDGADNMELIDVGGRREDLEPFVTGSDLLLSPVITAEIPSVELELHWQDLLSIMDPENEDFDTRTSSDHIPDSRPSETVLGVGSEALHPNLESVPRQEFGQVENPLQHGLLGSLGQSVLEQVLFPLIPSAELEDHSSAFISSNVNTLHSLPDHTDLLAKDASESLSMELNEGDNTSTFNMNLLAQGLEDNLESSQSLQYSPYPENLSRFNVNYHSHDTLSSSTPLDGNNITQSLLRSSNIFLGDKEENFEDDGDLNSQLNDLLDDFAVLDEIRLLDLALDEGFSSEAATRLEEEGCGDCKTAHHGIAVTEDQGQPTIHEQDDQNEAHSDSGLSLDFSHSPISPCASEASTYSSSSLSNSSSSSGSTAGSIFIKDCNNDAEEGSVMSDMEVEVNIKQEEEEEEIGAVGGWYPEDVNKVLPANYKEHKLFNDFSWQEQIDHDHTYNHPWSPASSPPAGKMAIKHTKSFQRYKNIRPYHYKKISKNSVWSRDERHARTLKIPFSIELIVNLPVEEFNDLLTNYQLSENQVTLIRDIRRRGKNKIAAQNCRKRKLDVLVELEDDVSCLRRHHLRLLREKQEALRKLQEMKHRLGTLYQEVFSRLRDQDGRPLNAAEYQLQFGPNDSVTVASQQQGLPLRQKNSKKQKDKKK